MYHKVTLGSGDALTVTRRQLEWQLDWLAGGGFGFVSLSQVLAWASGAGTLPPRPVLVTFDDAYLDTWEIARPVLGERGITATVFVPTAFIGGHSGWDAEPRPLMDVDRLRELAAAGWALGLHSHAHRNLRDLPSAEIAEDVSRCAAEFPRLGLPAAPVFAYPFGGRPRGGPELSVLREALSAVGVRLAFRIGGRVNKLPLADPLEVNRIGPRGDRSDGEFRRRIRWGRFP